MTSSSPSARIVPGHRPESIRDAVERLRAGRLVGLPTETVYGLAASTFDADAIAEVYRAKSRPTDNPLIAHVSGLDVARSLTSAWNDAAERIAQTCWPGPVTIVLPRAATVPAEAAGGHDSIAIRMPAHPVALRVLEAFGRPVSAPSANPSGAVSPTEARHVLADFTDLDLLILDGGPSRVGLESTVVDVRDEDRPTVLRPGGVGRTRLSEILGRSVATHESVTQSESPGSAARHYAPDVTTRICDLDDAGGDGVAVITIGQEGDRPLGRGEPLFRVDLPSDPEAVASLLYCSLHAADFSGAERIDLVPPPNTVAWEAIHDRIGRATAQG